MGKGFRLIIGGGILVAALLVGLNLVGRTEATPAKRDIIVAEVGKNRIYLTELNRATAPYKYRLEQQGYDFGSAQGRSQYQQLQTNVLNNLIVRLLLDQGVKEQRITLSQKELDAGYRAELARRKQTEQELVKELARYGWTKAIFQADLRRTLLERKLLDRLAKGKSGADRDAAVNDWLSRRAEAARIQVYFQTNSGGGGDVLKEAEKAALDYYQKKFGDTRGLTAKAENYGCHIQVDILKAGKVIKSFGYGGGEIYEI